MLHLGTPELLIILLLVLLLFGAKKVPELARGFSEGLREYRRGLREATAEEPETTAGATQEARAAERAKE
jgi:sec-independent protein translocase protein TatA